MRFMLCRNRVTEPSRWRALFAAHRQAHLDAGLRLIGTWAAFEDANDLFFMFEVESLEKAQAFIAAPEGAEAGRAAGVLEGEYHFLEDREGY